MGNDIDEQRRAQLDARRRLEEQRRREAELLRQQEAAAIEAERLANEETTRAARARTDAIARANYDALGANAPRPSEYLSDFHNAVEEAVAAHGGEAFVDQFSDSDGDEIVRATEELQTALLSAPPELRAQILQAARYDLERLFEGSAKGLNGDQTEEFTENLASIVDAVGPENAHFITDPLAAALHDGSLLEPDKGVEQYISVQEFIDGITAGVEDSAVGSVALRNALAMSVHEAGDDWLAEVVLTGGNVVSALPPAERQAMEDEAAISAAVDEIDDAADDIEGLDDAANGSGEEKSARRSATLAAAAQLEETLAGLPPELRAEVLRRSEDAIVDISDGLVVLDKDQTETAVRHLAAATDLAGPTAAHYITDPLAARIADHKLEQTGDSGDGGFMGAANNINQHNSEREFVDAINAMTDDGTGRLFQASLTQSLQTEGVAGFAAAVAGADSDAVPDDGLFYNASQLPEEAAAAVGELTNWLGDQIREGLANALNIDGRIGELNSEGDSFVISLGGSVGVAGVQGGAGVEMRVTKTADGYTMELMGEVSAGVFAEIGLDAGPSANASAGAEANITGRVTHTFTFDSVEDVTQAAETIGGVGAATIIGGPVGAAVTGLTAGEEIAELQSHLSTQRYELELSAEAAAGISAGVGGASISGAVTSGVALEIDAEGNQTLVLDQSLSVDGSLSVGAQIPLGPHETAPGITDNVSLEAGSVQGSAELELETRIPLNDVSFSDLASDPVGTVQDIGEDAMADATTRLGGTLDLYGGGPITSLVSQGLLPADGAGVEIEIGAEAPTADLAGALNLFFSGDINGALLQLADNVELEAEVRAYTEDMPVDLDVSASIGVASFSLEAQFGSRDYLEEPLFEFEGTPEELALRYPELFGALDFTRG